MGDKARAGAAGWDQLKSNHVEPETSQRSGLVQPLVVNLEPPSNASNDSTARSNAVAGSADWTRASTLTIETLTSIEQLRSLEPEWNELLRSAAANTVFLTWEWVFTWWCVYGKSAFLNVLVVRDHGLLVGIAPLKRVAVRVLGQAFDRIEFIGSGSDVTPEYLDVLVRQGYEAAATTAFAESLADEPRPHVVDLRPLRPDAVVVTHLEVKLATRGTCRRLVDAVCPVLDLPASADAFMKGRSRNYRKKVGEYQRRCHRELAARVRMSASREDVRRDVSTLGALHRKRWGAKTRSFLTDEYVQFHQDLAERALDRGWIRLFALESGSRTLAMLYCFSYDGHYYYYQAGWDPDYARNRVGLVLMHEAILQAIADGARVFDFLRGDESYKGRWATRRIANFRFTRWSSRRIRIIDALLHIATRSMRQAQPAVASVL
jgi:CelD/BcsL family acetyltransferase involved in cellulose biosynthesis